MAITYNYLCKCGRSVERKMGNLKRVRCFVCKKERMQSYARTFVPMPQETKKAFRERIQKRRERIKLNREQTKEQWKEREMRIVELRLDGKTLEQIAALMKPSLTRERVRQILERVSNREGITFEKQYKKTTKVATTCKFCGEGMVVNPSAFKEGMNYHKACKRSKWLHEDGTPMTHVEVWNWRYHNDPVKRASHKASMKAWYEKMKKDPEKLENHRKRQKVYVTKYQNKKKADPVWREAQNKKAREKWKALKADPLKLKKHNEDLKHARHLRNEKKLSTDTANKVLPPEAT